MAVKTKEPSTATEVVANPGLVERENLPAVASAEFDYGADAGAGMDTIAPDEIILPRLRLIAFNAPELKENSPRYNPDAKPGMIFNSVTGEFYSGKDGITITIVKKEHNYLEYTNRDFGGGFRRAWDPANPDDARKIERLRSEQGKFGKLKLPAQIAFEQNPNNELIETKTLYCIVELPDETRFNATIPFQSTQIAKHNLILTRIFQLGQNQRFRKGAPPLYAWRWTLRAKIQTNKHGDFYGWDPALFGGSWETALLRPTDEMYQLSRDFLAMLNLGMARADYGDAADDGATHDGPTWDGPSGEEVPF